MRSQSYAEGAGKALPPSPHKAAYGQRLGLVLAKLEAAVAAGLPGLSSATLGLALGVATSRAASYLAYYANQGHVRRVEGHAPQLWEPCPPRARLTSPLPRLSQDRPTPERLDRQARAVGARNAREALQALRPRPDAMPARAMCTAQPGRSVVRGGVTYTDCTAHRDTRFEADPAMAYQTGGFLADWHARRGASA